MQREDEKKSEFSYDWEQGLVLKDQALKYFLLLVTKEIWGKCSSNIASIVWRKWKIKHKSMYH